MRPLLSNTQTFTNDTSVLGLKPEVWYSFLVITILVTIAAIIASQIDRADPLKKPSGFLLLVEVIYQAISNYIESLSGGKVKEMYPYFFTITLFIFLSNISGLFGFKPPTSYFGVTLALAMITIGSVHIVAIKQNGFKKYWRRYIDPIPVLLPINIVGTISPLISLSLRLFVNVMSGGLILSLVYNATGALSSLLVMPLSPFLSQFNFIGPLITWVLHFYFDLFSGFIQTLVFLTLSVIFISSEVE